MEKYLRHFREGISPEIEQYAIDDVLKHSRYIFYKRKGKHQLGYCTHCRKEFTTHSLYHNGPTECPNCHSVCTAKASGRGRKEMVDEAYFVYYEKSEINPEAIVARGIYAVRDYSEDYRDVQTKYLEKAKYVFKMGESIMLDRYGYYSMAGTMKTYEDFGKCLSVYSLYCKHQPGYRKVLPLEVSKESIAEAVKGTPFQYSTWESYFRRSTDMVKFFDLYSRYPCIEYLTKLGMNDLVTAKLVGNKTFGAINWRGKTLLKVLKLPKKELNNLRAAGVGVDPLLLKLMQISAHDRSNLTIAEINKIKNEYGYYFGYMQLVLKYTTLRKAAAYIEKQFTKKKLDKRYYSHSGALQTWRDYINDCIALELDLTQENILLPSNLHQAHQNTIKQVKVKEDEMLNQKIKQRLKSLQKYCFSYCGLVIRPATSSGELLREGKTLNHCVGTYAKNYAHGGTNILVIRKEDDPDTPFYTVEIQKERVVQCRGNKNCAPTKQVEEFMKIYSDQVLNNQKTAVAV